MNGRVHYLGEWGAPDTEIRYKAFVEELLATGGEAALSVVEDKISTRRVEDLLDRYLGHCEAAYVKRGEPTRLVHNARRSFELLYRAGLTTMCKRRRPESPPGSFTFTVSRQQNLRFGPQERIP